MTFIYAQLHILIGVEYTGYIWLYVLNISIILFLIYIDLSIKLKLLGKVILTGKEQIDYLIVGILFTLNFYLTSGLMQKQLLFLLVIYMFSKVFFTNIATYFISKAKSGDSELNEVLTKLLFIGVGAAYFGGYFGLNVDFIDSVDIIAMFIYSIILGVIQW
jgi:hypothetical protein